MIEGGYVMSFIFEVEDWKINRLFGTSVCIRHMGCMEGVSNPDGACSCGGKCQSCGVNVPDELKGFKSLIEWER